MSADSRQRPTLGAWDWVSVGTSDLRAALGFWTEWLGFDCLEHLDGDDPVLRAHWGITDQRIVSQAMVRASGAGVAGVHLIELDPPRDSVRGGAQVFDLCPKNLDIYVDDLPRRMRELKSRGAVFRNADYSEAESPDGVRFREIHLPAHDDLNIVLLQILGSVERFPESGFRGIGPLISIVRDQQAERQFYRDVIGLSLTHDNVLEGPEIERMIGLPAGSSLEVSIWAQPGQSLGEIELVTYRGVSGNDLFAKAVPGARGVTQLNWRVSSCDAWRCWLDHQGIAYRESKIAARLIRSAEVLVLQSPAGLRIELHAD